MRRRARSLPVLPVLLFVAFATVAFDAAAQGGGSSNPANPATPAVAGFPTLAQQLSRDGVRPGSALEALIRANQDFSLLRREEAADTIAVPAWLRVYWRKNHPELTYSADDPTGGYPHVLKEIHEWMLTHQDLKPGPGDESGAGEGGALSAAATLSGGVNHRASGSQTVPRSESDIRINYWDTSKVIAASNNIGGTGRQGQYWSTDGGSTWSQTELPLATGDAFHSDPTVDWTSDGSAWSTTIGINSSATQLRMRSYKSTTNGSSWSLDGTFSGSQTSADKQMLWVDHSASSSYKDTLYACWHNGTPQYVNRRTSSGWGSPVQVSGSESTGTAIGCDIKTNANGDVFVFWPATGNRRLLMSKSTNGGASWGTPVIVTTTYDSYDIGVPSFNSRRALIYVSGGAYRNGSIDDVYLVWTDLTGASGCTSGSNEPGSNASSSCKTRIWFARSTNGGTSWGTPVMLNDQSSLNDQYNPWMVVDETTGALAVIYYDTVNDSTRKKTDVWYQSSFDHGASWSSPFQVTTAMTDETVSGANLGNQYGDYNGLSGYAGRFLPSWTDRRNNGKEEIWTAAVLDSPCTPPSAPTGLAATATGTTTISLSWNAVSGASGYKVFRSTVSGGPYTQIASPSGTSYGDSGLSPSTTYYYVVTATVSGCDSAFSSQASATTNTGGGGSCTSQTLYSDGFESGSGLGTWTKGTFVSGGSTTDWRGIQSCSAHGGSKIFRFGGSGCTSNYGSNRFSFAQPGGSSGIAVPSGSSATTLSFWHRRRFESGYDGGTLAVSVNGSNYYFVSASAITSGASYNGTISAACPPSGSAGAAVFTGAATSFVNTVVDLDAACDAATGGSGGCAGQSVRIAFTTITDCSVTDDGWFLDDVTVTACVP